MKEDINITTVLTITLCIGALFCVIKFCWQRRWLYYYGSKIDGPFGFPLLGSFHHFLKGQDGLYEKILKLGEKYKPIGKLWLGHYLVIFVSRPVDIEFLLKKCLNKGQQWRFIKEGVGDGLLSSKAEIWKTHRKYINLTFTQTNLNTYVDVFGKYANEMVGDLRECSGNNQIDLYPKFFQTTLSIILETSMGLHPGKFCDQYMSWLTRFAELITFRFYNPLYHFDLIWKSCSAGKEVDDICTKGWDYVRKVVEIKRRELIEDKGKIISNQRNFLDHLIKITDEDGKWSDKELMDETQTMIAAGSDTTAITQSFVMLMLAMHQEIQEKVYNELSTIFQGSNRDVTLEDLDKMVYLERVIKETLRLFPVGPILLRAVYEDVVVGSHFIPKDSSLLIPVVYVHRDPDVWPDPLKFDPDRFLPEEVAKRHRYSYMPFSIPPRDCIGKKFAMMSMKVVLSTVLRHFKVISCQYESIKNINLHLSFVTVAPKGYKMILEPR